MRSVGNVLCLVVVVFCGAVRVEDGVVRLPVPETQALKNATREIRELLKTEYANPDPAAKAALSRTLFKNALETQGDTTMQFALLRESQDVAVMASDPAAALAATEKIVASFDLPAAAETTGIYAKLAGVMKTPPAARQLATTLIQAYDTALQSGKYELLSPLSATAAQVAARAADVPVNAAAQERVKDAAQLQPLLPAYQSALATLKNSPQDPAANLTAGKFRCFIEGKWSEGLPLLAQSSDEALSKIAAADVAAPADAGERVALGDLWWNYAEKQSTADKRAIRSRALHWFKEALPGLTGLNRTRIEKRIAEAESAALSGPQRTPPVWISKDATFTVSSDYLHFKPSNKLLTGEGAGHSTNAKDAFSFITSWEQSPHIIIDLKSRRLLSSLEIENRRGVDQERAKTLTVWVAQDPKGPWVELWRAKKEEEQWEVRLVTPVAARYVKLGLREKMQFHLNKVKIMGW